MNTTLAPETDQTDLSFDPAALALSASVEAVRDALAHMDDDAVLSVPVGTPHENFDVVEWCAANRKPVINRFDPWPLETLIVRNAPSDDSDDTAPPDAPGTDPAEVGAARKVDRRTRRRRFRRNPSGNRSLDQAWHDSNMASTRSRMTVGIV